MSNLIATVVGRNRPLFMAFAMAVAVWAADSIVRILHDGMAFVTALFPSGAVLGQRLVIAAAIGGAAAVVCRLYTQKSLHAGQRTTNQTERKYRNLFDSMPDGVFQCRADGSVVAANRAMVHMLGYSSEQEIIDEVNGLRICANREQSQAIIDRLASHGEARDMPLDVRRKDGSTLSVRSNAFVIKVDGKEDIYQGSFTDMSELRAATDALRDSEEHFRALTENAVDVVTVANESGEVLYVSPSVFPVTGFMPEDLVGRSIFAGVHYDDQDLARQSVARVFAGSDASRSFICRNLNANGEAVHIETTGSAFRNSTGELRAVFVTRDVTQRRRTEQQLQQAQKMQAIGHLTGGIAHDFNNLLTVIVGNLQLLGEGDLDAAMSEQVDTAYRAAMQGADLTRRLLAFAKRQPLEPRVVDIGELMHAMDPLLHRSLGKLMNIEMEVADDLWLAKVDPAQLESAILNLAINSRDAMDGEGLLRIRAKNCAYGASGLREDPVLIAGEYVCISVEDNGSGMSQEVRKAAMEPFFSTKEDRNGSGLGLSMVYGFMQQSDGHIRLDSREGEGTCIDLYLPRSTKLGTDEPKVRDVVAPRGGSETVLVVDDNADVRGAAAAILVNLGYDIVEAASGKQALEVLSEQSIDLLFSDIKMPEMSGLELAEQVRERNPDTQILLTSGYAGEDSSGNKARSFEFLRKPYSRQDLAVRLRTILDQ